MTALLLFSAALVSAQSCSSDQNATSNKCDTVACRNDNECMYDECDGGYCLSKRGRPATCSTNPGDTFYKCQGMRCVRDYECYDDECEDNYCEGAEGVSGWGIFFIVVGVVAIVVLVAFVMLKYLKRRRDLLENYNNHTSGAVEQTTPFVPQPTTSIQ